MTYPINRYPAYHAHVYFDAQTLSEARDLCERTQDHFPAKMGRVHERPIGPHPFWSCQLSFDSDAFADVIAFLDAERGGLTILVHGLTGDDFADHTDHAAWLGAPVELNLKIFETSGG